MPNVPKRIQGYLSCDICERSVPYADYSHPEAPTRSRTVTEWPKHRCGRDVREFDRFSAEDPHRPAIRSSVFF